MKKILFILILTLGITSCGPAMYNTRSFGKENESYILVLKQNTNYENVIVNVDGIDYPIDKIYKIQKARKAHPISITTGQHKITITADGMDTIKQNIFIGLQETKQILLK